MTAAVTRLRTSGAAVTVADAIERFVAQPDLLDTTLHTYRASLARFADDVGADTPLEQLDEDVVEAHLTASYGTAAPAYFNRHRAAIGSLFAFAVKKRWVVSNPVELVDRRKLRGAKDRTLSFAQLEASWTDPAVALRERCLWVTLYETAARASEILQLNVEDLDLAERSATITGKGGDVQEVFWATTTARLLDRLLAGRSTGPVFVGDRRPKQQQPARDLTPEGYGRLSYRRAEEIFTAHTGWTLHQLRHSSLTHLAEAGVDVSLLKAKSRHASLRSLEVYLHPSRDTVKRLTAEHDSMNRHRR